MAKQNAITFNALAVENECYKVGKKMPNGRPAGIIVHSTGANNPNLWRYVDAPEICGENPYGTHWNTFRPIGANGKPTQICCHAFIGKDKDGEVRAAKLLPWDMCCWNCASGSKGSYNWNPAYIQFEICEDGLDDPQYFKAAFTLAARLCARLMRNYDIPIENVISHHEAYLRGYASNHIDPEHWLKKFGKDMDWFRKLVLANGDHEPPKQFRVTGTKLVQQSALNQAQGQLKALGFEVAVQEV